MLRFSSKRRGDRNGAASRWTQDARQAPEPKRSTTLGTGSFSAECSTCMKCATFQKEYMRMDRQRGSSCFLYCCCSDEYLTADESRSISEDSRTVVVITCFVNGQFHVINGFHLVSNNKLSLGSTLPTQGTRIWGKISLARLQEEGPGLFNRSVYLRSTRPLAQQISPSP